MLSHNLSDNRTQSLTNWKINLNKFGLCKLSHQIARLQDNGNNIKMQFPFHIYRNFPFILKNGFWERAKVEKSKRATMREWEDLRVFIYSFACFQMHLAMFRWLRLTVWCVEHCAPVCDSVFSEEIIFFTRIFLFNFDFGHLFVCANILCVSVSIYIYIIRFSICYLFA